MNTVPRSRRIHHHGKSKKSSRSLLSVAMMMLMMIIMGLASYNIVKFHFLQDTTPTTAEGRKKTKHRTEFSGGNTYHHKNKKRHDDDDDDDDNDNGNGDNNEGNKFQVKDRSMLLKSPKKLLKSLEKRVQKLDRLMIKSDTTDQEKQQQQQQSNHYEEEHNDGSDTATATATDLLEQIALNIASNLEQKQNMVNQLKQIEINIGTANNNNNINIGSGDESGDDSDDEVDDEVDGSKTAGVIALPMKKEQDYDFLAKQLEELEYQKQLLSKSQQQLDSSMHNAQQIDWMIKRSERYKSWFANGEGTGRLARDADEEGPIIDFAISGFPKCGSTTMMANLGRLAPMPIADVCVPVHQVTYYAHKNWPHDYAAEPKEQVKMYRGTKCPAYTSNAKEINKHLPKTKLIIGIRHPVLWFQSFWNMQATNDYGNYQTGNPYARTSSCEFTKRQCQDHCPEGQLFCVHRSRFHLNIAKFGKTPMDEEERKLLAFDDFDGGAKVSSLHVRNPIFLYEQTELPEDYVWDNLATFLNYPNGTVPHDRENRARGQEKRQMLTGLNRIDICEPEFDDLRAQMMPYAYQISKWFCGYLLPVAQDPTREDVHFSDPDKFCSIVRNYENDPCDRLIRSTASNATYSEYVLQPHLERKKYDHEARIASLKPVDQLKREERVLKQQEEDDLLRKQQEHIMTNADASQSDTQLVVYDKKQQARLEWMQKREENYDSWYENGEGQGKLVTEADKDGPILDFAIAGFPKCGSTTMMNNLGRLAPMPIADVCVPVHQAVYYAHKNWPNDYAAGPKEQKKIYRGTKCPQYTNNVKEINKFLPRTKLIIGIRHPVLWFQSFWNMQATNDYKQFRTQSPYDRTESCEGRRKSWCNDGCPFKQLFCVHRARFHRSLAVLGKTPLDKAELSLLAPDDFDGGDNLHSLQVRNPIFLYEMNELSTDYLWDELATYLDYHNKTIAHDRTNRSRGTEKKQLIEGLNTIDICAPKYDRLRMQIMPYAYQMSLWICDYLIPVAQDPNRDDVFVANPDKFCAIVRQYAKDPCDRLIRDTTTTFSYVLKDGLEPYVQGEVEEEEEQQQQQQLQLGGIDNKISTDSSTAIAIRKSDPSSIKMAYDWMEKRELKFDSWYENKKLRKEADKEGPILDFVIAGFAKCGSTTVMANLGRLAPMPVADICAQAHQAVWYAYKSWPTQYGEQDKTEEIEGQVQPKKRKWYRGTKCPQYTYNIKELNKHLPRTKMIIGIRNPVLWFQSFWNMQATNDYKRYKDASPYDRTSWGGGAYQCANQQLFCVHRSRFHISLAKMGKTKLGEEERNLLAPNDLDGGMRLKEIRIRNPIFIYEQTTLSEDFVWESMSTFLNYDEKMIPHDRVDRSRGNAVKQKIEGLNTIDICDPLYDRLRAQILPYGYEMSQWLCQYLLPVAKDDSRDDVFVAGDPDEFCTIVKSYEQDPCHRLVRNPQTNAYALPTHLE